jgi:transcriptional regulator with XRE-family HTH domain
MPLDSRLTPLVEALRDVLAEKRISQAEVERRAKMPERYLSKLLNGHVRLTMEHVLDVLDAAGVEPHEFFLRLAGHTTSADIERRVAALEAALRQQRPS